MKKKNLVLVDFNNLLYRSVFAHQTLSYQGKFTGGIFGFIDMVASTVNRYKADRIIVCQDLKPYHRSKFYPEYKSDRKKMKDDMEEDTLKQLTISRRQILRFIAKFKIPFAWTVGHEADDFIGVYCRRLWPAFEKIFIMSNDSDLFQLLRPNVFLSKTGGLYGLVDFKKDWPDIDPSQWPRCVALKGSHNGVAGIHGVGDVTAYKAVAAGITNEDIWFRWRMRRRTVEVNTSLATFPFPLVERPDVPLTRKLKYNALRFEEECDRYGIRFKDEFHAAFTRLSS